MDDFVVCAEAEVPMVAAKARKLIASKLFVSFFCTITLSRGIFVFAFLSLAALYCAAGWRVPADLLCLNRKQPLRANRLEG
jgi:hypothetical protein